MVDSAAMDWAPSPSASVWRKRLHLVGGAETGQVTSIVRYDPDSSFPSHDHPDGEEILVLDGVFSDLRRQRDRQTGHRPRGAGDDRQTNHRRTSHDNAVMRYRSARNRGRGKSI